MPQEFGTPIIGTDGKLPIDGSLTLLQTDTLGGAAISTLMEPIQEDPERGLSPVDIGIQQVWSFALGLTIDTNNINPYKLPEVLQDCYAAYITIRDSHNVQLSGDRLRDISALANAERKAMNSNTFSGFQNYSVGIDAGLAQVAAVLGSGY